MHYNTRHTCNINGNIPPDVVAYFLPSITPIPEKRTRVRLRPSILFPSKHKVSTEFPREKNLISEFKNRKWCAF